MVAPKKKIKKKIKVYWQKSALELVANLLGQDLMTFSMICENK